MLHCCWWWVEREVWESPLHGDGWAPAFTSDTVAQLEGVLRVYRVMGKGEPPRAGREWSPRPRAGRSWYPALNVLVLRSPQQGGPNPVDLLDAVCGKGDRPSVWTCETCWRQFLEGDRATCEDWKGVGSPAAGWPKGQRPKRTPPRPPWEQAPVDQDGVHVHEAPPRPRRPPPYTNAAWERFRVAFEGGDFGSPLPPRPRGPASLPRPVQQAVAVLGVGPDVSPAALRAAYVAALHRAHPDKGGTREKFEAVRQAYKVLTGWRRA